ncbi:GAP family protein [Saccharopolyspora taberi]|uniref:GAP family protein n=1 Tax=Saccharopolyspora taberi TaxID=60895 RepID=A0ABN3VQ15_9PSEU
MNLQVLPLAVTMMAGPQIMSAIVLVTSTRAVRNSVAFVLGVLVATVVGLAITRGLAAALGSTGLLEGRPREGGSVATVIQVVLVLLLALLAVRAFLTRRTAEPPKWMESLMEASPATSARTGLLVILLMPSDIVVLLTVGMNLEQHDAGLLAASPFIAATALIAALPLLAYLLFRKHAVSVMPQVREWMNTHSWLINIGVCLLFIVLVASG